MFFTRILVRRLRWVIVEIHFFREFLFKPKHDSPSKSHFRTKSLLTAALNRKHLFFWKCSVLSAVRFHRFLILLPSFDSHTPQWSKQSKILPKKLSFSGASAAAHFFPPQQRNAIYTPCSGFFIVFPINATCFHGWHNPQTTTSKITRSTHTQKAPKITPPKKDYLATRTPEWTLFPREICTENTQSTTERQRLRRRRQRLPQFLPDDCCPHSTTARSLLLLLNHACSLGSTHTWVTTWVPTDVCLCSGVW